ncbi:MAG: hypothetical protein E7631_06520 [Ruminococcaceae bacterium]|nr:hypothetical protein [Oscillospiraceae bacterium]
MKKLLAMIMAAVCVLGAAVAVSAEISFSETEPKDIGEFLLEYGPGEEEMTEHGGNFSNLATGGQSFCNKMDGWARYEFSVDVDGVYAFVVDYIAREGKARSIDVAIDDKGNNQWVDLVEAGPEDHRYAIITAELTAGKHNFFIMAPTGFDDDAVKSCDVYGWDLYLVEEIVPETEAETVAAAEEAPAAPQTFDAGIVAAVASLVAAAGYAVSKKSR